MSLTFYILSVLGAHCTSSSKILTDDEIQFQGDKKLKLETESCIDGDTFQLKHVLAKKTSKKSDFDVSSNDEPDADSSLLLEKMLEIIEKATNEIINEIFYVYLYASITFNAYYFRIYTKKIPPSDEMFDEYLKDGFCEKLKKSLDNISENVKEKNKIIYELCNDAYDNFILAKTDYLNLLDLSRNFLLENKRDFDNNNFKLCLQNFFGKYCNSTLRESINKLIFKDQKSVETFIEYVYLDISLFEDLLTLHRVGHYAEPFLTTIYTAFNYWFKYFYSFFYRKEINLHKDIESDISKQNCVNLINAIINYLNHQKLDYFEDSSFLSKNVYSKLKLLVDNTNDKKIYNKEINGWDHDLEIENPKDNIASQDNPKTNDVICENDSAIDKSDEQAKNPIQEKDVLMKKNRIILNKNNLTMFINYIYTLILSVLLSKFFQFLK